MPAQSENILKKIESYLKSKITPGKFDWLIWTLIIWLIWLDKSDFQQSSFQLSIPFGISSDVSDFLKPFFLKFVGAGLFSALSHLSLRIYVGNYLGFFEKRNPHEVENLLKLLNDRAGIGKIYEGKLNHPAIKQSYFIDMMKELRNTRSIKLLSIAGYENIGKGVGDSLFYDFLRNENIDVEVILLNPDDIDTIGERIKQIRRAHKSYSMIDVKREIKETIDKLKILKSIKGDDTVKGYYCRFHPIFRLSIFDTCLFMSTYERDRHGHESPVYKINKVINQDSNNLSLYDTFLNFFEKVKKNSDNINLSLEV